MGTHNMFLLRNTEKGTFEVKMHRAWSNVFCLQNQLRDSTNRENQNEEKSMRRDSAWVYGKRSLFKQFILSFITVISIEVVLITHVHKKNIICNKESSTNITHFASFP